MNKFKNVVNSDTTQKVTQAIELIENQWNTIGMINKRADILATEARTLVGGNNINSLADTYNGDTLNAIYNLTLPSYMAWDYFIAINQWVAYWVNRNEIECDDDKAKAQFKMALSLMRMYGQIAVTKQNDELLIGTMINPEFTNGEVSGGKMLPSFYANKYGYLSMSPENKTIKLSDEKDTDKLVTVTGENTVFAVPRANGIGDFVWCMKDILIDLYLKTMIQSNASNLQDKMFAEVNNPKTLPLELWLARNPFITYGVKINDSQSGSGTNEFKFSQSKGGEHSYINTLIEALKHHQEYYYAKYGRPISSNKAQALSSDSSLSISSAEAIATDWDDRVEAFANDWNAKFGTNIKIVKPELDTPPMNENADKEGLGKALTEGDLMEQQAKVGK